MAFSNAFCQKLTARVSFYYFLIMLLHWFNALSTNSGTGNGFGKFKQGFNPTSGAALCSFPPPNFDNGKRFSNLVEMLLICWFFCSVYANCLVCLVQAKL